MNQRFSGYGYPKSQGHNHCSVGRLGKPNFRVNHNDFWNRSGNKLSGVSFNRAGSIAWRRPRREVLKTEVPVVEQSVEVTGIFYDLLTAKIGGSDRPSSPIKYPLQYNPIIIQYIHIYNIHPHANFLHPLELRIHTRYSGCPRANHQSLQAGAASTRHTQFWSRRQFRNCVLTLCNFMHGFSQRIHPSPTSKQLSRCCPAHIPSGENPESAGQPVNDSTLAMPLAALTSTSKAQLRSASMTHVRP